jgi:preprotein translocase subunit SecA
MFIELIESIKYEIVKIIFTIQLQSKAEEEAELERMKQEMEASNDNMKTNHDESPIIEKKIARNSPCPCGSGKKYKQCCGKSGPKRGLVAK